MDKKYKYKNSFSGRLAILCSDERFVKPTIDFLNRSLGMTSCDFFILPGGPESIASKKSEILNPLKLLVDAHDIKEAILVSHEDCSYYKALYKDSSPDLVYEKQGKDLVRAMDIIKGFRPGIKTTGYYCRIKDRGSVYFEKI